MSLLPFHPDNFHFPHPSEPPSMQCHVVDEELEVVQENRCGPALPPPSHHTTSVNFRVILIDDQQSGDPKVQH